MANVESPNLFDRKIKVSKPKRICKLSRLDPVSASISWASSPTPFGLGRVSSRRLVVAELLIAPHHHEKNPEHSGQHG